MKLGANRAGIDENYGEKAVIARSDSRLAKLRVIEVFSGVCELFRCGIDGLEFFRGLKRV